MDAKVNGMSRVRKTHEVTWWNERAPDKSSNLDRVCAARYLAFAAQEEGADIETQLGQ